MLTASTFTFPLSRARATLAGTPGKSPRRHGCAQVRQEAPGRDCCNRSDGGELARQRQDADGPCVSARRLASSPKRGGISVCESIHRPFAPTDSTSNADKNSLIALQNFHDAVRIICGEETVEMATRNTKEEGDSSASAPSDAFEMGDQEAAAARATGAAPSYQFAHLSFEDEPDMIWRWWIWKVPIIVFLTPAAQAETGGGRLAKPYDVRFWKIAWTVPPKERFVEAIPDRYWMNLPVWDSNVAPGQPW